MKKKRIAQYKLPHILLEMKLDYLTFYEKKIEGKGYWLFKLRKKIGQEEKDRIKQALPEVIFFTAQAQYAPELKRSILAFPKKTQLHHYS